MNTSTSTASPGIGFGCALAIVLSWTPHKSLGWAILHGICSWFYVIYYMYTQSNW